MLGVHEGADVEWMYRDCRVCVYAAFGTDRWRGFERLCHVKSEKWTVFPRRKKSVQVFALCVGHSKLLLHTKK